MTILQGDIFMKYTKTERLNIGKQIYERKLNRFDAAIKYEIDPYTARDYMRYYKSTIKDTLVTKKAFKNNCRDFLAL